MTQHQIQKVLDKIEIFEKFRLFLVFKATLHNNYSQTFLFLDANFLVTENDGYCCTSDNVRHDVCIITNYPTSKGYVSGFEISECETKCLNDDLCKGFSINTMTDERADLTFDNCYLYTTSDASPYCTFNDENLKAELEQKDWSADPLDQNARCLETMSLPSTVKMDYYLGCQIKFKTNNKAKEAKKEEIGDGAKKVEEAKKGKEDKEDNDLAMKYFNNNRKVKYEMERF